MKHPPEPIGNPWAGLRRQHRATPREKVLEARSFAGRLIASEDEFERGVGQRLLDAMHGRGGMDLQEVLGYKPPRGSRMTMQRVLAQEQRDRILLELSAKTGGDRAAIRLLRGDVAHDKSLEHLVLQVLKNGLPSISAFGRARRRISS